MSEDLGIGSATTQRVALLAVVNKAAGLLRTFVAARTLGATSFGDAYTAANAVPNVLVDVVANGVANGAVVPTQAAAIAVDDLEGADRAISAQLTWILVVTMPLMVVAILARNWIAHALLGSSGDERQQALAGRMLIILLLQIPLYAVGVIMSAALQARRRFLMPATAPMISSVIVTATYVLFGMVADSSDVSTVSRGAELLLVGGTTIGVLGLTLPLAIPLLRTGWRYHPSLRVDPGHRGPIVRLGAAGAGLLAAQQLATVITMRLSSIEYGGVVVMSLALTVFLLPQALVGLPLSATSVPELAAASARGESQRFETLRARLLLQSAYLGLGAGLAIAALSPLVAWVLLHAGPGDEESVKVLGQVIAIVALPAGGLVISTMASRICFAAGKWREAAVAGASCWLLAAVVEVLAVTFVDGRSRLMLLAMSIAIGFTLGALIAWRVCGPLERQQTPPQIRPVPGPAPRPVVPVVTSVMNEETGRIPVVSEFDGPAREGSIPFEFDIDIDIDIPLDDPHRPILPLPEVLKLAGDIKVPKRSRREARSKAPAGPRVRSRQPAAKEARKRAAPAKAKRSKRSDKDVDW